MDSNQYKMRMNISNLHKKALYLPNALRKAAMYSLLF